MLFNSNNYSLLLAKRIVRTQHDLKEDKDKQNLDNYVLCREFLCSFS